MIKYIKHNLAAIDGVGVFPIIAFILFFVFFIAFIISVYRMDSKTVDHIKNLPFDSNSSMDKNKENL